MTVDPIQARIQRLEENQGFTERAVEQLSQEIRDLGARVHELTAALARMETKVEANTRPEAPGNADSDQQ